MVHWDLTMGPRVVYQMVALCRLLCMWVWDIVCLMVFQQKWFHEEKYEPFYLFIYFEKQPDVVKNAEWSGANKTKKAIYFL